MEMIWLVTDDNKVMVDKNLNQLITTHCFIYVFGGGGEIRTHEGRKPLPVFKTGAFNRSATPPRAAQYTHCSALRHALE